MQTILTTKGRILVQTIFKDERRYISANHFKRIGCRIFSANQPF